MQIKITLFNRESFSIPLNYNYQVQSGIYACLQNNPVFSEKLHNEGFSKGCFKLFTFGSLLGDYKIKDKQMQFSGNIGLEIRSVIPEFQDILKNHLVNNGNFTLLNKTFDVKMVEVTDKKITGDKVSIKTLSPIVVHQNTPDGKRYYFTPSEPEFQERLNQNYQSKYQAFYGECPIDEIKLSMTEKPPRKVVTNYKGFWITAWTGSFTLHGLEQALNFLYNTGLGTNNSKGFGMFEVD